MDDLIYVGIVAAFFVITVGLMKLCETLGESKTGEKS